MKWQRWANKRQFAIHASIGGTVAFIGSIGATLLNAHPFLAFMVGIYSAVVWFTAKEATDETVYDHFKQSYLHGDEMWHGWSWSDYAQGQFGGLLGSTLGMILPYIIRNFLS
jgi:hypothetical protein